MLFSNLCCNKRSCLIYVLLLTGLLLYPNFGCNSSPYHPYHICSFSTLNFKNNFGNLWELNAIMP